MNAIMKPCLLMLLVFIPGLIFAQQETGRPPLYRPPDSSRVRDIREKLVQLALQNPAYEIADHASRAAGYQVKIPNPMYYLP